LKRRILNSAIAWSIAGWGKRRDWKRLLHS